jgi:hypothetical protein
MLDLLFVTNFGEKEIKIRAEGERRAAIVNLKLQIEQLG